MDENLLSALLMAGDPIVLSVFSHEGDYYVTEATRDGRRLVRVTQARAGQVWKQRAAQDHRKYNQDDPPISLDRYLLSLTKYETMHAQLYERGPDADEVTPKTYA